MPRASEERGPAVKLGLFLEVLHQGFGVEGVGFVFIRLSVPHMDVRPEC